MIAKVITENQRDWPLWVPHVTFCYNATTHSATHFPPLFIFTGRLPLWHINLVLPDTEVTDLKLPEYAAGVINRLNEASKLVRSHLQAAAQTASKWYNNKAKVKTFKPGDIVRVYYPRRYVGRSPKWQSYYSTVGQVVERLNDVTYLVASKQWKKNKVIHVNKIKNVIFSIHVSAALITISCLIAVCVVVCSMFSIDYSRQCLLLRPDGGRCIYLAPSQRAFKRDVETKHQMKLSTVVAGRRPAKCSHL